MSVEENWHLPNLDKIKKRPFSISDVAFNSGVVNTSDLLPFRVDVPMN